MGVVLETTSAARSANTQHDLAEHVSLCNSGVSFRRISERIFGGNGNLKLRSLHGPVQAFEFPRTRYRVVGDDVDVFLILNYVKNPDALILFVCTRWATSANYFQSTEMASSAAELLESASSKLRVRKAHC
jgi:hypothetical protein